jgi:endonuclease YncB( thermonuclease family)
MFKKTTLSIFFLLLFLSNSFAQQSVKATVVGVVDGDTITVITKDDRQLMFQLVGIEAPEKDQDFGAEARAALSDLILNKSVIVSGFKKDCLDRNVASVLFNNKDLSASVVETGRAWTDSACQTDNDLLKKELSAKENKIGLWQNSNPIRPSDFRSSKQQKTIVAQTTGRRIYAGLAPIPPPPIKGLYIGMTVDSFKTKCGKEGKMSQVYTSEGYQSFDITVEDTKENIDKGCAGSFSFRRTSSSPEFELKSAFQTL